MFFAAAVAASAVSGCGCGPTDEDRLNWRRERLRRLQRQGSSASAGGVCVCDGGAAAAVADEYNVGENSIVATYCPVCSETHILSGREQRPDDTDSFTPRVRSDKRSVTMLLGRFLSVTVNTNGGEGTRATATNSVSL